MISTVKRERFMLSFEKTEGGFRIKEGAFGAITLGAAPLFTLTLRDLSAKEERVLTSDAGWAEATVTETKAQVRFFFRRPDCGADIAVSLFANITESGVTFETSVSNLDPRLCVMEVSYPKPAVENDIFDLFLSSGPGKVIKDFRHGDKNFSWMYPSSRFCMQYMAVLADGDALYIGHHDREARTKYYSLVSSEGKCELAVSYPAEGMNLGANSFSLRGGVTWEYIKGDWFDCAMRYAEFAKTADWLPKIGAYGRPDSPDYFKEIPFWIMDFMLNIPEQGDNMPETLRHADKSDRDAWWREAIALKEKLGLPVGYHIYNWHKNAFNIDYPHFLPAKDDFKAGVEKVRKAGIYIAPYINASSWESRDQAPTPEESFEVCGYKEAAKDKDGNLYIEVYPQIKPDGQKTNLIAVCPSSPVWHRMISRLSERIEDELSVDGIYYDQTAAMGARPCADPTHSHAPGNSGAWIEGTRALFRRIRSEKDPMKFSFTECNAEPYMDCFDGYLTWHWGENGEVPAFPAIYSRYITMIGRVVNGWRKKDLVYTRYTFAKSFVQGQQLGWINHDVQKKEEVFPFLYRMAHLRYEQSRLFITGSMLRPPIVETDLPTHTSTPHMWGGEDLVIPTVVAGGWRDDAEKTHLFVINISDTDGNASVTLRASEYGARDAVLGALLEFSPVLAEESDTLTLSFALKAQDILHITF